jgi:tellurite resistance protein
VRIPSVPASFFGIVLGIDGLGIGWRLASRLWGAPLIVGEVVLSFGALIWLLLAVAYGLKWLLLREEALAEFRHPVQCCFVGLVGVSTLLMAVAAVPHSIATAWVFFAIGFATQFVFALYRTGELWKGGRDAGHTTPILYLPLVAGNFVSTIALCALGRADWGILLFGAGLFAWLAVESVILNRLYNGEPLPPPLRPALGISLAPPVVGAVAWLYCNGGQPDFAAKAMLGYGLLYALLLARLLPWIAKQPFSPAYWGFSFGVTALANAAMLMTKNGVGDPIATLAGGLFVLSNVVIAVLLVMTLALAFHGRLVGVVEIGAPRATQPV